MFFSCNSDKQKSIDHFNKAKECFKNKDWNNASKENDIAIKLDSSNFESIILKSKIKEETKANEEAIQILKSLLNKNYKTDTINFLIADNYFEIGNYYTFQKSDDDKMQDAYNSALTYFDKAIKINSQYIKAYDQKQKVLFNLDRFDEAVITLNNAIGIFPKNMSLISARGIVKDKLGDKTGAISDLNMAINSTKLDSMDLATALRFRGNIYFESDSLQNAIIDFTKAISYNPNDDLSFVSRGELYRKLGEKDKACDDFRKAADLGLVAIYETIKEYCNK
jgi:tetratricopeptide (TPR) repeat protein